MREGEREKGRAPQATEPYSEIRVAKSRAAWMMQYIWWDITQPQ